MKIAIIDEVNGKFTNDLKEHWEEKNEVRFDKYLDPKLVLWADVTLFDFAGNNVQRASDPNDSFWQETPQPKNKRIILRCHDIDIWVSQHTRVNYDWIDHLVFVSEHMMDKALPEIQLPNTTKVSLIKHGVNSLKFTFRKKERGKKIAWIANICDHKKLETALLILADLPRDYSLSVVGSGLGSWRKAYVDNYIKTNNLNVEFFDSVESVNDFLEDKDFLISTGTKESFGFVSAEAMLKGIKTLIHNFWGSDKVWENYPYVWNKISEVVNMIEEDKYEPEMYRDYILNNYSYQEFLDKYDKILYS